MKDEIYWERDESHATCQRVEISCELALSDHPGPLVVFLEVVNGRAEDGCGLISVVVKAPVVDPSNEICRDITGERGEY